MTEVEYKISAAAGKVVITPEEETPLGGFDPRANIARPPGDILDDLFARILIMDDGKRRTVFVSVDCVRFNETSGKVCKPNGFREGIGPEWGSPESPAEYREVGAVFPGGTRRSWAQAAGADEADLLVAATHTHSAPDRFQDKYVDRIRDTIRELAARLVPVKLSIGVGSSDISAYRRPSLYPNPDVPIDRTLHVVLLETLDGKPMAGMVGYAVHPTILHPSDAQKANRVSAECVGMAMSKLEEHIGEGFVSLYLQGFSGDIGTVLPGIGTKEDSYGNVKLAGTQLYADIVRTLQSRQDIVADVVLVERQAVSYPTRNWFFKPYLDTVMTAVSFGDVCMLMVPGEIFNGYVAKIRDLSPFTHTIPVSLTNDYVGYFPTEEAFLDGLGGYEIRTSPFDARVEGVFTAAAAGLFDTLYRRTKEEQIR